MNNLIHKSHTICSYSIHEIVLCISSISLLLLTTGLLAAWNTPCTGYEPNIYTATPLIFWIGVIACYLSGIGILLISQFYKTLLHHVTWIAYTLMLLAFASLISLTLIRGYFILNVSGDTGTHIGGLALTIMNGAVPATYYPSVYIEPAAFQLLTGINGITILSIFPMLMLGLFTLGVHILSKRVFPHKGEVCLATIIALLTPVGSFIVLYDYLHLYMGMTISNVGLLVIFIYVLFSCCTDKHLKFIIPTILLIISIAYYHPYVAVITCVITASTLLFAFLPQFGRGIISKCSRNLLFIPCITAIAAFITAQWQYFGSLILSGVESVFETLSRLIPSGESAPISGEVISDETVSNGVSAGEVISGETVSNGVSAGEVISGETVSNGVSAGEVEIGISSTLDLLNSALENGYGLDTVIQIAGINIFMYGMILVAGIILLYKFWTDKRYMFLKMLFVCACAMALLILVSMAGNFVGDWERFLRIISLTSLISTGFVLYQFLSLITHKFTKTSLVKVGCVFVILSVICISSVMTFHPSPNTLNGGYQTTQTEYIAAETLLPYINQSKEFTGISFNGLYRFDSAITPAFKSGGQYSEPVINHFGYDIGNMSLASHYNKGGSIVITERDKKQSQIYYSTGRIYINYYPQDFQQLTMDPGMKSTYKNGGFELYQT